MTKQVFITASASLLILFSSFATGADFSYDYMEFRTGSSPESFGHEVSMTIMDSMHIKASVDSQLDNDWNLAAGLGFNGPVSSDASVFGDMLLHNIKYPSDFDKNYETLLELSVGIRMWITDGFEGYGKLGRIDRHSVIGAGVRFHSPGQLSMNMETSNNGIWGPQLILGVRLSF